MFLIPTKPEEIIGNVFNITKQIQQNVTNYYQVLYDRDEQKPSLTMSSKAQQLCSVVQEAKPEHVMSKYHCLHVHIKFQIIH